MLAPVGAHAAASSGTDDGASPSWFAQLLAQLDENSAAARASEPDWAGPLVTGSGLLSNRVRFDAARQHADNNTSTTLLDGSKGIGVVLGNEYELQISGSPYDMRDVRNGRGILAGFGDGPAIRIERKFWSAPESSGDYVVTAWLQVQAPQGITRLSSKAWLWTPELAAGKGWGDFDIQATLGVAIPASHQSVLGEQILTNVALQYRVLRIIWPVLELNSTYFAGGLRGGLNQTYLTSGVVLGIFSLDKDVSCSFGAGYEMAISPGYHAVPLTPAFDHALIFSARLFF